MSKQRFQYHFEPPVGWMNDPNGLVDFNGKYHVFYQHNPHAPKWAQMHWGHAVTEDFIHWEHLPIALYPDQDYDNGMGCFSGSAVVKDGRLYLFYTSVSEKYGQTQSVVFSDDGMHFHKYENNPVIDHFPEDGSMDFRDPKVVPYKDKYLMVLGTCKNGKGRVVFYESLDLLEWKYRGILYESLEYNRPVECPDFFPLGDKWVLSFSKMDYALYATQYIVGSFDGDNFSPESYQSNEAGPQFYAPQTFETNDGRRIQMTWWRSPYPEDETEIAGALTIPRELTMVDGQVCAYPVAEARHLLVKESSAVKVTENCVEITDFCKPWGDCELKYEGPIVEVDILEDWRGVEVFINRGTRTFSFWRRTLL